MEQQKYSSKHLNYSSENNEKYRESNYKFIKKYYLGEPSSAKVLDIGCGDGRLAYLLYDLFEEWHGIDSSSIQIKQARSARRNYQNRIRKGKDISGISREAPVRRIFFKEGSAEKVPHAEGKFDIIVYSATWHFIKNPEKANDLSVTRIQVLHSFLPHYEKYCTEAIVLPFPNKDIYNVVINNSTKAMLNENIRDPFEVHINQIWSRTIINNYASKSIFQWQDEHINLRRQALDFVKSLNRYIEATLERNASRVKSTSNTIIRQTKKLSAFLKTRKALPQDSIKYFEEDKFKSEQKAINDWYFPLENFLNQFTAIVLESNNTQKELAIINLKSIVEKLSKMQTAFVSIQSKTFAYFQIDDLAKREKELYSRLLMTTIYFVNNYSDHYFIDTSSATKYLISKWWKNYNQVKLEKVHRIIKDSEKCIDFKFHLPRRLIEEDNLRQVVIGVETLEMAVFDEQLLNLLGGLVELINAEIDFITIINIRDSKAIIAIKISIEFIKRVKVLIEDGEFEDSENGNPLPVEPDENLLECLDGITYTPPSADKINESFISLMYTVWELQECKNRLDKNSEIEKKWLNELFENLQKQINNNIELLSMDSSIQDFQSFKESIDKILAEEINISTEEIVALMNAWLENKIQ